jgi:hypothetical protein
VLGKVLKASPALQSLFLKGHRLAKPFAKNESGNGAGGTKKGNGAGADKKTNGTYQGLRHPTYFKIEDVEYGTLFTRNCEIGRRVRIAFTTDVENEYFDRPTDRGSFELELADDDEASSLPNYSISLEDGIAHLNMALPDDVEVGQRISLQATVNDPTLTEPFVNVIRLHVMQQAKHNGGYKKKQKDKQQGGGSGDREEAQGIKLPGVIPVRTDDDKWRKYGFEPETACHVISDPVTGDDGKTVEEHTFFINVDNLSLKTEMKYSKQDPRLLEAKFKYGNVLLGLAMIHDYAHRRPTGKRNGKDEAEPVQDRIRKITGAVAPVLLPMIDQLSGLDETELEEMGMIGEDA